MKISTLLAAAAVAVAGLSSVQAVAKVPLTHEALWMMKRVGSPEVSPDGKWVVFSISEPSYEPDKAVSDLWLVPTAGGAAPKRLTNTKAGENGVVWSPDSTKIAFTTKREGDEVEQVYVLDVIGGGEARRVTSLSTAATRPQWRPDGQAILFETMVYPGALDDEANKKAIAAHKARKYNVRTYEHFPIRYWNEWLDERMPAIEVVGLEPGAKPKDILSPTKLARTPGFSGPEGETSISLSPVWSPDGKEVVFSATVERWNAAFSEVNYQLYRLPVDGGEAQPITPEKGGFRSPTFSADGKTLYFNFAPRTEEIYNLARFSKVAWPAGGAITTVAKDFDREPERFQITPDGKTAFILVPEAGKTNLYSVPTAGGKPALVIEPATGGYGALTIPQKAAKPLLIANYGSSVSPEEIVRIDPAAKSHANLTNVDTAEAQTFDWQPPQHFWFTSAGGRQIHNMIILPPNFDPAKKYPLLVFIHGGAASMNTDSIGLRWNYHLLTAAGYVMLMTDYTGSTGFGEKFAQQIKLDPLKTPGLEIDQAVNEALKRYSYIDGTKMCALGASYGGHMVNWLEATTTRYKCLVSHAGEVDLESQWGMSDGIYNREVTNGGPPWEGNPIWRDQSPITYAKNWKTPMLLSIGERDFRVPIGNTLENWSTLQRMKVPSRLLVWPDAWHWILKPEDSRHFYQEVDTWLAHYLKDGPAPPAPGAIK